jgi:hypothetical protein
MKPEQVLAVGKYKRNGEKQIDWESSIGYTPNLKKYTLGGNRIV